MTHWLIHNQPPAGHPLIRIENLTFGYRKAPLYEDFNLTPSWESDGVALADLDVGTGDVSVAGATHLDNIRIHGAQAGNGQTAAPRHSPDSASACAGD